VDSADYRAQLEAAQAAVPEAGFAPGTDSALPRAPVHARPAGFWIRAVAVVIDAVALFAAQGALRVVAWVVFAGASARAIEAAAQVFGVLLGAVYPVVFHWLWGQTLGKMAVQVRVVTMDGGALSLWTAAVRQLGSWLSAALFGTGYLIAGLRSDKRALHDLIAGTRVERLSG
jgi:uncharacterized RDD family membrane protein YckC